ncbi:MAG: Fe-S cluster assembly scaffold protein NifU [Anaerolineae bacterium]
MGSYLRYSDLVMEHFMNPRNVGVIPNADGVGREGNPVCGDMMEMFIKVNDQGIIEDIKFRTFGCGAAIATSSITTEMVKGKHIDEARQITKAAIAEALGGLPPIKMHCSVLAADALNAAIEDYEKRKRGEAGVQPQESIFQVVSEG